MKRSSSIIVVSVIALALTLTGCVDSSEPAPFVESAGSEATPLSGQIDMTIKDFHHHPNTIVAKAGSTIHVTNLDVVGQSLASDDASLNTGILGQGESADLTLTNLGQFVFSSEPYPTMTGSITVVP